MPALPPLACDSHMHVFDGRFAFAPQAHLRPPPATVQDYRQVQQRLGLARVVVVQPSSYGTDNRCTLDAVARLGPQAARAVVVVEPGADEAELGRLHAQGARGVRLNLARGAAPDLSAWARLLQRARPLGWHLQLHCGLSALEELAPWLEGLPVPTVLDHLARVPPQADARALATLRRLLDGGRLWVKLSAPYLDSRAGPPGYGDMQDAAHWLLAQAPERMLWGSDWPHPAATAGEVPMPHDAALLHGALAWCDTQALADRVLQGNPAALYGFGP